MTIVLGCIADDYTGASDLANTLTQERAAHRADDRRARRAWRCPRSTPWWWR